MAFDDHSTVVALEFLIKRLVVKQCSKAHDAKSELRGWVTALAAHRNLTTEFAFKHAEDPDVQLNAISAAGEMDRIAEEIVADAGEVGISI